MNDKELLLLGGGVFVFWLVTRRKTVTTSANPLPTYNPNGAAAGLNPQPNTPKDPSDVNNWLPGLLQGLGNALPSIISATQKKSGPSTSSGTQSGSTPSTGTGKDYTDPSASDWASDGDSIPDSSDWADYYGAP